MTNASSSDSSALTADQRLAIRNYLDGLTTRLEAAEALGIRKERLNDVIREIVPSWIVGWPFDSADDWRSVVVTQWAEFLKRWPLTRLATMTANEYMIGDQRCSFCYWLEHGTKAFATIGGSGGVRMYGCYLSDGVQTHINRDISFETLRNLIVAVAKAASVRDFDELLRLSQDRCGLFPKVFWKIALLYQPFEAPYLSPVLTGPATEYPDRQREFTTLLEKKLGVLGSDVSHTIEAYWETAFDLLTTSSNFEDEPRDEEETTAMLNYQTHAILKLLSYNKNVILQGAPGTGKTWSIPEVVTRLCGRVPNDQEVDRHTVIEAYKRLLDEGRVVFTTFHPSYDYEDFVEGWVPGSEGDGVDTSGQNPLHVRPGIFRQICRDAAQSAFIEEAEKLADENFNISDKADVWKVSLCHTGPNPLRELCLANNCIRIGWPDLPWDVSDHIASGGQGASSLNYFYNEMKPGDIVVSCFSANTTDAIGMVKDGPVEWVESDDGFHRSRSVEWIWKGAPADITEILGCNMTLSTIYSLTKRFSPAAVRAFLRERKAEQNTRSQAEAARNTSLPYVLVIDEINRGNIAKIFGELITLLEADKRRGGLTESSVTLPYSQAKLTVPENLYVIGTMNTADRSIGMVDYALRRRFAFYRMEPQILPERFNQFLFKQVQAIFMEDGKPNRTCLSEEFDPFDVMPGQSYFVAANDEEKHHRFTYELKPLLEEYLRDGVLLPAARPLIDDLTAVEQ